MALEISFELGNGAAQVEGLAGSLMKVADNADNAKQQLTDLFKLDYSGAAQFKDFVKEFTALDLAATGLKGAFSDVVKEIAAVSKASAEALTQIKSLNTEIVNNQKATNASVKALKDEERQIEETAKARKKGESELVRYTEGLDKQNLAFGKTLTQLLKYKEGWVNASGEQEKAAQKATALAEAMGRVGTSINAPVTAMQKFKQAIADATLLQKEFAEGSKETGITQDQYTNSVNKAKKELEDSIAVLKRRNGASAEEVRAFNMAKRTIGGYVDALVKVEKGQTNVVASIDMVDSALERLAEEEHKTDQNTKALSEAMKRLGASVNLPVTAFSKFEQALADVELASKRGAVSAQEYLNANTAAEKALLDSISALRLRKNASKDEVSAYEAARGALDSYIKSVKDFKAKATTTIPSVYELERALEDLRVEESIADQNAKALKETIGRLGSSISAPTTAFKTFKQAIGDANSALKQSGITTTEHANAIAFAKKQLIESVSTLKLRENASKGEVTAYNAAKASLKNYVNELTAFRSGLTSVEPTVAVVIRAMSDLKTVQDKADQSSKLLNEAMGRLGSSINAPVSAFGKFKQAVADANLASKQSAITSKEYENAISSAKKELIESVSALKLRANASEGEVSAYFNAKTAINAYLKSLVDFQAGLTTVAPSINFVHKALAGLSEAELRGVSSSKQLSSAMSLIAPLVAPQLTALEKYRKQLDALSLAQKNYKPASLGKEQEGINYDEYVRGVNSATAAFGKLTAEMARNGTEALKHITSMKDQLAVMGKTSIELVRMKEGYKNLTVDQKLEAQQLDKNIQAMKDTEGLTRKVLTAQELYNKQVLDLTRTHQLYIRTKGEQGRSEAEVKRGMDAAREALNKSVTAEDKLRTSLSKTSQVRDASYSQLKSYVDALQKEAAQLGKTEKEIIENGQAFDKQSAAKKRQIRALQDYVEAMRAVAPMLQKQLTPLERYNQGMERLNRLHAQFKPAAIGKPQVGISGAQYDIGSANLKKELDAATLSKVQAAKAALTLGHNYGVVNQVTAAFRATLQGANLSFGMFTSSTILSATAAFAFSKALSSALTIGSQFEVEFERAAIVMGEFGSTLEGNLGTLQSGGKLIKSEILSLAEVTQYGTVEVAKAAATLAQAGLTTAEVYSALAPTLDLAAIAMVDVAEAADMAVGVMYGFGAGADDLGRIVDVMAAITVRTNLNLKQVATTMKYAAPIAAHMGLEVEDLGAAISVLGNNAIKSSQAGTSLRSILIRTAAPTTAAGKAFQELGISISELTKTGSLDLNQLFTLLEKKGASARQMKDIFGQWAITSAYAMRDSTKATDEGTRSWAFYQKEYAKVAGTSAEMAKALRMNLTGAVENLGSVIESIGTKAFDIFGQGLEDQIRRLSKTVSENSDVIAKSLGDLMATLTSFAVAAVEWSGTVLKVGTTLTAFFVARAAVGSLIGLSGLLAASTELLALKSGTAAVANKSWASSINNVVSSFSGVVLGSGAIVNAQTAQAAATDAATKAGENQAAGVAKLGRGIGIATSLLSGWLGVILVLVSTAAPLLYDWFSKTEEVVVKNNVALENYAALTKDAKEGMSGLESVSTTQLEKLNLALEEGAKLQITNSEAASLAHAKAIQELDQQIAKLKELQEAQRNPGTVLRAISGVAGAALGISGLREINPRQVGEEIDYLSDALARVTQRLKDAGSNAGSFIGNFALITKLFGSRAYEAKKLQEAEENLAKTQQNLVEKAKLVREEAARTRANDIANMAVKGQLAAVTVLNTVRETAFKDALAKTSDKAAGAIQGYKNYIASLTGIQKASSLWVTALTKMKLASFSFDKLLSKASAFNSFLEDKLGLKQTDADLSATIAENEAKATQSIKDSQSALEAQIKTYQKATGSSAELSQKLKEVGESQAFIASGGAAAAETLAKLGLNAEQATVALEANKEALMLEGAEQYLSAIDVRYKDFGKTLDVVTSKTTSASDATKLLVEFFKTVPGVTEKVAEAFAKKLVPGLKAVDTGAKGLREEFQNLQNESAKFWAEAGSPKDTKGLMARFEGLPEVYKDVDKAQIEFTLNTLRFKEVFSSAMEGVKTDSEKLEEAGTLFEFMQKNIGKTTMSSEQLIAVWERFQENSPIGQLKLSNQNLENQIALTLAGVDSLELYNASWENTKGHLENLDPAFVALKQRSIELNKELERINQIRGIYQQFGDGLARMFADVFNGGIKSFKDFASKLKGMFTQMLADLVYIYLKRNIFDKMTQGLMSMFSGGQGGGIGGLLGQFTGGGATGGGGGITGLIGGIGRMFGFGGTSAVSGAGGAFGALGTAAANAFGFGSTAVGAGGSFGAVGNAFASAAGFGATGASAAATGGGLITGSGMSAAFAGVPIIGWIAAAVMANLNLMQSGWAAQGGSLTLPDGQTIRGGGSGSARALNTLAGGFLGFNDTISGILSGSAIHNRLFGRKAPELTGSTTNFNLSPEGGSGSTQYRTLERGGVFRSDRRRTREGILSDEVKDAIQDLFNEVKQVMVSAASQLKGTVPEMISAAIREVVEYDSKGKVKTTKYFVDLLGRTWEEETSEAATKRVIAEAMIATIDSILGTTVTAIRDGAAGAAGTDGAGNSVEGSGSRSDAYSELIKTVEAVQGEASAIAERWRDDAEKLYEGASFLLLAATDMRAGMGLLGEGSTLTNITDLIEELGLPTETLSDTYARVYMSANLLTDALDLSGVTLDLNREAFVRFATDITTAAGGLEQAQGLWSSYFNTFYSETERLQLAVTRANTSADRNFDEIGLDYTDFTGEGGLASFRTAFEDALPTLSATEIVQWLRAGESLGLLSTSVENLNTAVENSTQELRDLMAGVNEELGQFAGNSVAERIARVSAEIDKLTAEATKLGATPAQLAIIASLEDARIAAILKEYDELTAVYLSALDNVGASTNLTGRALTEFVATMAEAAGGLEEASGLWSQFFEAFYPEGEFAVATTTANATSQFQGIGLNIGDYDGPGGMNSFRELFADRLPELSPEQIVTWLRAGLALDAMTDAIAALNEEAKEAFRTFMEGFKIDTTPGTGADLNSFEEIREQSRKWIDFMILEGDRLSRAAGGEGLNTEQRAAIWQTGANNVSDALQRLQDNFRSFVDGFKLDSTPQTGADAGSLADARTQAQAWINFMIAEGDRLSQLATGQFMSAADRNLIMEAGARNVTAAMERLKQTFDSFMDQFKVDPVPRTGADALNVEDARTQSMAWISYMISEADRLSQLATGTFATEEQRRLIWEAGARNMQTAIDRLKENFRGFVDQFKVDPTPATGSDAGSLEDARTQAQAWINFMISEGDRLSQLATGQFMSAADRNVIMEAGARNVAAAMERLKQTFDSFMDQFKVDPTPASGADALNIEDARTQSIQWINYMISEADRLSQLATGTFATEEQRRLIWEAGARNVAAATQRLKDVFNNFMDGFKVDPTPASGENATSVSQARLEVFDWVQYMIAEGDRLAQDAEGRFLTAEERVAIWEAGALRIEAAATRLRELFNNFLDGFRPDLTPETGENASSVTQAMQQSSDWVSFMIAEGNRLALDAHDREMTQAERDVIIAAGARNVAAATLRLKEAFQSFMDGFKLDNTPSDGLNASSLFQAQQEVSAWVDYMIAEADRMSRDAGQGPLSTENRALIQAAGARNLAEATRRIAEELSSLMSGIDQEIAAFGGNEFTNRIAEINSSMQDNIYNATRLGATFADLAKITQLAELQIAEVNRQKAEQLSNLMQGIEGELAELEGTTYIRKFQAISDTMEENIRSATRLGASLSDLGRIQRLASLQVISAIAELRESIEGLVTQLYGPDSQGQINATGSAQSEASSSNQDAIRETSELELERYNAAQSAIKRIDEYLRGLMTSQLAPGSWQDRLGFAENDFQEIFDKAMSGDPEAMAQLTDAANTYLQLAQDAYGPGIDYTRIFDRVTAMLRRFQEYAATIIKPTPVVTPEGGGGGGGGGSGGSGNGSGMTEQERYRLALQLAGQIGALGLALDTSVFSLMREFGVDIKALAEDLGIDVGRFSAEMGTNLGIMARSLNVGVGRLVDELGITREQLAVAFGVSITDFSEANIAAILEMGATLGISVFESMELLGVDLAALATSFGIDVANLNSGMGVKLVALADILGVSLTELTTSLGINLAGLAAAFGVSTEAMNAGTLAGLQAMATALGVSVGSLIDELDIGLGALATSFGVDLGSMSAEMFTRFVEFAGIVGQDILSLASSLGGNLTTLADQLVDSFSANLETLPGVPDDIEEGLAPYLRAIRDADSSSGVITAVGGLQTYINSLPQGVANSLNTLLASLGILPGTGPSQATLLAAFHAASLAHQGNIVTALGAQGPVVTASEASTSAIVTSVGNAAQAQTDILGDLLTQLQTSTTRIVNAINGVPEEPDNPPPDPLARLSEADFSRKMEATISSRRTTEDSEVSDEKEEALQKALKSSAETAESLKKVERKLDDTLKVLNAKLAEQKEAQDVANAHLAKIAKKTSQLVEKDGA